MAIGSILFALANEPSKYWPYMVPAMILGMLGVGVALVGSTIVVMDGVRDGEEGVVSAVMFTSYQVGATLGLASEFYSISFFIRDSPYYGFVDAFFLSSRFFNNPRRQPRPCYRRRITIRRILGSILVVAWYEWNRDHHFALVRA